MADSNRGSISRRLRFEILRRDNHQCRYCGASAPDAKLTVDHVLPVALGGSDESTNLVTACQQCNAGKATTSVDAPLVADIKADALRWARAVEIAAKVRLDDRTRRDEYVAQFEAAWSRWQYDTTEEIPYHPPTEYDLLKWTAAAGEEMAKKLMPVLFEGGVLTLLSNTMKWARLADKQKADLLDKLNAEPEEPDEFKVKDIVTVLYFNRYRTRRVKRPIPKPAGWRPSLWQFYAAGLPIEEVEDAVEIACGTNSIVTDNAWRYFCGVCWRKLERIREAASNIVVTFDGDTDGT